MDGFRIGANTLFPDGPLRDSAGQFGLEALERSLDTIRDAGMDGVEFSHFAHLDRPACERLREACRERGLMPWSAHTWVPIPSRRGMRLEETARGTADRKQAVRTDRPLPRGARHRRKRASRAASRPGRLAATSTGTARWAAGVYREQ